MKSRETLIRLQRFEVSERRQKLADIEMMIADFKRMANDLEHQIKVEQETSGIKDVKHFAYSTFAKAAAQRRDNLLSSIKGLEKRLGEAQTEVDSALEELKKMEMAEERETGRGEDATGEPLTRATQTAQSPLGAFVAQPGAPPAQPAPARRPDTSVQPEPAARSEPLRQQGQRPGSNLRLIGGA